MSPEKQRKIWWGIGGVLILGFLAYGFNAFKGNLTPYVLNFDEAMQSPSRVQVAGKLVADSTAYHEENQELVFKMSDQNHREMVIRYKGVRPANFEDATQVVAVGSWNGEAFVASQLLVKCPSKYQGVDADVGKHRVSAD